MLVQALLLVVAVVVWPTGTWATCTSQSACSTCSSSYHSINVAPTWHGLGTGRSNEHTYSVTTRYSVIRIAALSSRWTCTFMNFDCSAEMTISVTDPVGADIASLRVPHRTSCFDVQARVEQSGTYRVHLHCHNSEYECQYHIKFLSVECTQNCLPAGEPCVHSPSCIQGPCLGRCCSVDATGCTSCSTTGTCDACSFNHANKDGLCFVQLDAGRSCDDNRNCRSRICKSTCCAPSGNERCEECDDQGKCSRCERGLCLRLDKTCDTCTSAAALDAISHASTVDDFPARIRTTHTAFFTLAQQRFATNPPLLAYVGPLREAALRHVDLSDFDFEAEEFVIALFYLATKRTMRTLRRVASARMIDFECESSYGMPAV